MLEFDYLIERNDGKSINRYTPTIDRKLENLISISAPNDYGKSTLLNLIALSFFGLENKRINPSLIKRMESLVSSNHQKIKFKIHITKDNLNLQVKAEKDDLNTSEIYRFEKIDNGDFETMTKEYFDRKYLLIYDIPDNPLGRITDLNTELYDWQRKMGDKIKSLNDCIGNVITEINNSKDPKKIDALILSESKLSDNINDQKRKREITKNELKSVEKYSYCRFYLEYKNSFKEIEQKLKNFENLKNTSKKKDIKFKKQDKELLDKGNELLSNISNCLSKGKFGAKKIIFEESKNILFSWESINIKKILYDQDDNDILINGITEIKKILLLEIENDNKNPDIDRANLLSELIELLNNYRDLNANIPGVEKNIPDFIDILEKEYRELEKLKTVINFKRNLLQLFEEIEYKRKVFILDYAEKMQEIEENISIGDEIESLEEEDPETILKDLQMKCIREKSKFENYERQLSKIGVNLIKAKVIYDEYENDNEFLNYRILNEGELDARINGFNKEILDISEEIIEKEFRLRKMKSDIFILENLKTHKYQNYLDYLNSLFVRTQKLGQKILKEYEPYLEELRRKKVNFKNISIDQKNYYEKIAIFLGKKLFEIRHENRNYEIERVNVLAEEIITIEGKIIKYTDLGTGQGQAAYLKGLLNLKGDNRKVIALIDEVAMMDSSSLNIVYDSLKKLDEDGKLLLGIVVQKSDEPNTKQIF